MDRATPRQVEVLRLTCRGLSAAETGALLCIAPDTVRNTLTQLYRKLREAGCGSPGETNKAAWYCYWLGVSDAAAILPEPTDEPIRRADQL